MSKQNRTPGFNAIDALMPKVHRPPLTREAECARHGLYLQLCHFGNVWLGCSACAREDLAAEQARDEQTRRLHAQQAWAAKLGESGIPERFLDRTLESYVAESSGQRTALEFAQAYADGFDEVRRTGRCAVFLGKFGTGKTHLACGIGLQVMRTHQASVLFMTASRMVRKVRDTWRRGAAMSESEAVASIAFPDLLIVDEVGVQRGTEDERNVLFDVLNQRYESRKPTLLLSNCELHELESKYLGERVMDRLREDGGAVVGFPWGSRRAALGRGA